MWKKWNPNPCGRNVGDCSVRAIAKAVGLDWETAYATVVSAGFNMCDMPSSDAVFGSVLRKNGFRKVLIPNECPDCYTIEDFCKDNPNGVYVLGTGGHVVTVVDGDIFDSWDSSNEIPIYAWYEPNSHPYNRA